MSKTKALNRIIIDIEKCKGCELCVIECKEGVIKVSDKLNAKGYYPAVVVDISKCTGCTFCAITCPEAIIEVIREGE